MTEEQLNRAININNQIAQLKCAMADVLKVNLFRSETGCSHEAIPFLAKLHTETVAQTVDKIGIEIKRLQKEFDSL